jgi:ketosteroid isomerase-like protein
VILTPLCGSTRPTRCMTFPARGWGPSRGEEAIRRFLEDWHQSWEDYHFEEEENLDLGHGVWLSVARESGRLAGGKGRVETRVAQVAIWSGGKCEWLKAYPDPDAARAAAERLARERGGRAESR